MPDALSFLLGAWHIDRHIDDHALASAARLPAWGPLGSRGRSCCGRAGLRRTGRAELQRPPGPGQPEPDLPGPPRWHRRRAVRRPPVLLPPRPASRGAGTPGTTAAATSMSCRRGCCGRGTESRGVRGRGFEERWRVRGPGKDYEIMTTLRATTARAVPCVRTMNVEAGADGLPEYRGTIPRLLAAAADRDSEGVWLRSDSGVADLRRHRGRRRADRRGAQRGRRPPRRPGHDDRAEPPALPDLLAGADLPGRRHRGREPAQHRGRAGRPHRPDPAARADHRRGPGRPGGRRAPASLVVDVGRLVPAGLGRPGRHGRRRPPGPAARRRRRPRRPGRPHPDVRHHRPVQARHPDPPGLRHGRRGLPVLDGARPPPTG